MGVGARLGIRTRTSRHRAGVLPLHQRAVGRASPNRRVPPSFWTGLRQAGRSRPYVTSQACHGMTVRRAHPADTMGTPTGLAPVFRLGRQCAGSDPMPRCMIRRDNRFRTTPETVPATCGSAVFRRHPGGLGQEPHAAIQGTPPTAGWVSCPIPRTRWGVDGRADGMGTARPRIRCAGCASYSVPEPSASRPHEWRP